jgi:hypothetical protein
MAARLTRAAPGGHHRRREVDEIGRLPYARVCCRPPGRRRLQADGRAGAPRPRRLVRAGAGVLAQRPGGDGAGVSSVGVRVVVAGRRLGRRGPSARRCRGHGGTRLQDACDPRARRRRRCPRPRRGRAGPGGRTAGRGRARRRGRRGAAAGLVRPGRSGRRRAQRRPLVAGGSRSRGSARSPVRPGARPVRPCENVWAQGTAVLETGPDLYWMEWAEQWYYPSGGCGSGP